MYNFIQFVVKLFWKRQRQLHLKLYLRQIVYVISIKMSTSKSIVVKNKKMLVHLYVIYYTDKMHSIEMNLRAMRKRRTTNVGHAARWFTRSDIYDFRSKSRYTYLISFFFMWNQVSYTGQWRDLQNHARHFDVVNCGYPTVRLMYQPHKKISIGIQHWRSMAINQIIIWAWSEHSANASVTFGHYFQRTRYAT